MSIIVFKVNASLYTLALIWLRKRCVYRSPRWHQLCLYHPLFWIGSSQIFPEHFLTKTLFLTYTCHILHNLSSWIMDSYWLHLFDLNRLQVLIDSWLSSSFRGRYWHLAWVIWIRLHVVPLTERSQSSVREQRVISWVDANFFAIKHTSGRFNGLVGFVIFTWSTKNCVNELSFWIGLVYVFQFWITSRHILWFCITLKKHVSEFNMLLKLVCGYQTFLECCLERIVYVLVLFFLLFNDTSTSWMKFIILNLLVAIESCSIVLDLNIPDVVYNGLQMVCLFLKIKLSVKEIVTLVAKNLLPWKDLLFFKSQSSLFVFINKVRHSLDLSFFSHQIFWRWIIW